MMILICSYIYGVRYRCFWCIYFTETHWTELCICATFVQGLDFIWSQWLNEPHDVFCAPTIKWNYLTRIDSATETFLQIYQPPCPTHLFRNLYKSHIHNIDRVRYCRCTNNVMSSCCVGLLVARVRSAVAYNYAEFVYSTNCLPKPFKIVSGEIICIDFLQVQGLATRTWKV